MNETVDRKEKSLNDADSVPLHRSHIGKKIKGYVEIY